MASLYVIDWRLVPPAPLCFAARSQWLTYIASAQAAGPELRRIPPFKGKAWNPAFSPCRDCTASHEAEQRKAGRCTRNAFAWMPEEATA